MFKLLLWRPECTNLVGIDLDKSAATMRFALQRWHATAHQKTMENDYKVSREAAKCCWRGRSAHHVAEDQTLLEGHSNLGMPAMAVSCDCYAGVLLTQHLGAVLLLVWAAGRPGFFRTRRRQKNRLEYSCLTTVGPTTRLGTGFALSSQISFCKRTGGKCGGTADEKACLSQPPIITWAADS
jgi:hypothetical protein